MFIRIKESGSEEATPPSTHRLHLLGTETQENMHLEEFKKYEFVHVQLLLDYIVGRFQKIRVVSYVDPSKSYPFAFVSLRQ